MAAIGNPISLQLVNNKSWTPKRLKDNCTILLKLFSAPEGTQLLHVGYKTSAPDGGRCDWFAFPSQYKGGYIHAQTLAETLGLEGDNPAQAVIKHLRGWFIITQMTHAEWNTLPTAPDPGGEVYRDGDYRLLVISTPSNGQSGALITVKDPCDNTRRGISTIVLASMQVDALIETLRRGGNCQMEGDKGICLNLLHGDDGRITITVVGWGPAALSIEVPPRMIPAISNALRRATDRSTQMH